MTMLSVSSMASEYGIKMLAMGSCAYPAKMEVMHTAEPTAMPASSPIYESQNGKTDID